MKAWVDWNIKANVEYNGMPWNVIFPLVCHQLWLVRNQKIFIGVNVSAQSIIAKVLACANFGGGECINPCLEVDDGRWRSPVNGYVKINVDVATTAEGNMTACSGIMCDYRGEVKESFLFKIGRGNNFLAKT